MTDATLKDEIPGILRAERLQDIKPVGYRVRN